MNVPDPVVDPVIDPVVDPGVSAPVTPPSDAVAVPPADAAPATPVSTAPPLDVPPAPPLRTDGPTLAEFVAAGYPAERYPPPGYAAREDAVTDAPSPSRSPRGLSIDD